MVCSMERVVPPDTSEPRHTACLSRSMSATGLMPLMRELLELAQWTGCTPRIRMAARSRLSLWTQWAMSVLLSKRPYLSYTSQYCRQSGNSCATKAISPVFSDRWDWTGRSRSSFSLPRKDRSSGEQEGANRGVRIGFTSVKRLHFSNQRRVSLSLSSVVSHR